MISCYIGFVYPSEQSNWLALLIVLMIPDYYLIEHFTSIDEFNRYHDCIGGFLSLHTFLPSQIWCLGLILMPLWTCLLSWETCASYFNCPSAIIILLYLLPKIQYKALLNWFTIMTVFKIVVRIHNVLIWFCLPLYNIIYLHLLSCLSFDGILLFFNNASYCDATI
jgi:hypothetical protein